MPGQKRLAGALAAVAAAVALSACGSGGDDKTLSPQDAATLTAAVDGVEQAVNERKCDVAQERADGFIDAVNALPDTVGTEDKEALREAGENLEKLAADPDQCKPEPDTGPSGFDGPQPTTTSEETTSTPTNTTTTTSSSTTTTTTTTNAQPPSTGTGGNAGGGSQGGGEPSGTGGGQSGTGSGGSTGGGSTGGGSGGTGGGTGGTGTGGTGGGGTG